MEGRGVERRDTIRSTVNKIISQGSKERVRTYYIHTWLVQTLLNVTNAKVCASIVPGSDLFARASGMASAERKSCGTNATDSNLMPWF